MKAEKYASRLPPRDRVNDPRCECGHLFSKHNDLGYCQVPRRAGDGAQCPCDSPVAVGPTT